MVTSVSLVKWLNVRFAKLGWFHLNCLKMKEGIGLLGGKQFVCNFCLSSKVLELMRVVRDLQSEVKELREALKNGRQLEMTKLLRRTVKIASGR